MKTSLINKKPVYGRFKPGDNVYFIRNGKTYFGIIKTFHEYDDNYDKISFGCTVIVNGEEKFPDSKTSIFLDTKLTRALR